MPPNMGAANYINQLITKSKKHISDNTIIVGDFNYPITEMDRSSKQKINKEIKALNDTLDQMDITDIFRPFHPKATEYTFFSSAHGTFSRIDHTLGHKSSLNWYQKIRIIPCIFTPQYYETRTQSQEESWKELKYMEAKENPTKE